MKKWLYGVIILLIIGIVSGFFLWKIMVSPQYSLKQVKASIHENNLIAFQKLVDLDSIIDSIIDQVWQYYVPGGEGTGSRWSEIRNEIGFSLLSVVKPNLKEIIKREVCDYITTGKWTVTEAENDNRISSLIIEMIKERIDPGEWDHQSINYTEIEGETAHVGLTYYDQTRESNFILEVKMIDMKGYWQIIEITNFTQLMDIFQNIDHI